MLNILKPQVLPNFEVIQIENVCRICLHSPKNMLSLFYNEIDCLISEFLPQKLYRKPLQPHQICTICFEQAKTAYVFKKQCEYSDEIIRSMLNEPNINKTYEKQTQTDSNLTYPCEKCEKKFESSEILKEHRLKEHQNTPNICRACGNVYKTITTLRRHLISVHPELGFPVLCKYKCHLCEDNFTGKSTLKRHLFDVHNIGTKDGINGANEEDDSVFVKIGKYDFSCGNCLENFAAEDDLNNHECIAFIYEEVLEENSNSFQSTNDCDKNRIEIVLVSEENNECFSVFEDNLKTDDEEEENTVEKSKDEIFASEIKIENKKLYAEKLKAPATTDGAMITEPKEKISKDVKTNANSKRHFQKIAHIKSHLCSECGLSFSKPNGLKIHMRRHRGEMPCKCRYCDKGFPSPQEKHAHERTHKEERNYHCTVCSKKFNRYDNLQVHMRTHTGERPYKCSYCSMAFTTKFNLKQHYRTHTGERSERCYCDLCSSSYSTSRSLLNHKREVHGVDQTKEFSCRYCSEKIIGATEYEKHRKAYHPASAKLHHAKPPKAHICSECGTSFKKSQNLSLHIRTHTGEKPYKCQYCDKAFASLSNLLRHKRIHTEEKNYHCANCSKAFVSSDQLKVHMRIHTGERPYKCSYCPMAFSENRSLKKHRMKHAGE